MFRTIRFRLALWYTSVVAVIFILFGMTTYEYLHLTLARTLDRAVRSEIDWMVSRLERGTLRNEPDVVVGEDIFEHGAYYPLKEYVEIWDSTGKIYYRGFNLAEDTLKHFASLLRQDGDFDLRTVTNFRNHDIRLATQKTPSFVIYFAIPLEVTTSPLRSLLNIFFWLGPLLIVVAMAGGMYLARKSFAKVNEIVETAQKITVDRLHDRIPEHLVQDEIGKLISTFNDMISRLDRSFEQMRQFSGDASHELRTPLSVMRTQLEEALSSKITLAELKKTVASCLDESIRMSNIVDNLLLLAKSDAGKDVIRKERVDLQKLVRQTYDESVILASQKAINVTLRGVEASTMRGDEERLRQMFLNLIDNAIKYTPRHGRIHLSLTQINGAAKITIGDNGIGIPENEIPRIFDRFYRVDRARSRKIGGAGLGLSIVKWIVDAHGGRIEVESTLNKGSEFSILLPLDRTDN
ncbi:MAG TPA: ATP-binding protein [Bacteroidota bacterium]|nr:ATP-binding protein [Bacteroidota bacterium]